MKGWLNSDTLKIMGLTENPDGSFSKKLLPKELSKKEMKNRGTLSAPAPRSQRSAGKTVTEGKDGAKARKYRNIKTIVDGVTFDSKKEAQYYQNLCILKKAGNIKDFNMQVKFPVVINNIKICTYIADFEVIYSDISKEIIDVKSEATRKNRAYRIKKKCVEAIYGFKIVEV